MVKFRNRGTMERMLSVLSVVGYQKNSMGHQILND
jgi:hypothetical protein